MQTVLTVANEADINKQAKALVVNGRVTGVQLEEKQVVGDKK